VGGGDGLIALPSIAGFWIGITVPLCVAAAAFGRKAIDRAAPAVPTTAALNGVSSASPATPP